MKRNFYIALVISVLSILMGCTSSPSCYENINDGEARLIKTKCDTCIKNRCHTVCDSCRFNDPHCKQCIDCIHHDSCERSEVCYIPRPK